MFRELAVVEKEPDSVRTAARALAADDLLRHQAILDKQKDKQNRAQLVREAKIDSAVSQLPKYVTRDKIIVLLSGYMKTGLEQFTMSEAQLCRYFLPWHFRFKYFWFTHELATGIRDLLRDLGIRSYHHGSMNSFVFNWGNR